MRSLGSSPHEQSGRREIAKWWMRYCEKHIFGMELLQAAQNRDYDGIKALVEQIALLYSITDEAFM